MFQKNTITNGINNYKILSKISNYQKGLHLTNSNADLYDFASSPNYWEMIEVKCPCSFDSTKDCYVDGHAIL